MLFHRFYDLAQSARQRLRQQHTGVAKNPLKLCSPFFQRAAFQVLSVQVQQVESVIDQRPASSQRAAILEHLKRGPAMIVHGYRLAVQDEGGRFDL